MIKLVEFFQVIDLTVLVLNSLVKSGQLSEDSCPKHKTWLLNPSAGLWAVLFSLE